MVKLVGKYWGTSLMDAMCFLRYDDNKQMRWLLNKNAAPYVLRLSVLLENNVPSTQPFCFFGFDLPWVAETKREGIHSVCGFCHGPRKTYIFRSFYDKSPGF